jgi:flagellar biosynthesis/type III secretory pathway chaperone
MNSTACEKDLSDLQTVILTERTALLTGDLEQLGALANRKEHLIGRINVHPPATSARIEQIREALLRNQTLLRQAMNGVRSISERLLDLRRVRNSLGTYDSRGNKAVSVSGTPPSFEKRT